MLTKVAGHAKIEEVYGKGLVNAKIFIGHLKILNPNFMRKVFYLVKLLEESEQRFCLSSVICSLCSSVLVYSTED